MLQIGPYNKHNYCIKNLPQDFLEQNTVSLTLQLNSVPELDILSIKTAHLGESGEKDFVVKYE